MVVVNSKVDNLRKGLVLNELLYAIRSKHGKVDQKNMCDQIPNFKYASFQQKHKKVDSKLLKSLIMEVSIFPLSFDELNTK